MDQPATATAPNPPQPEAADQGDNKALKALRVEREARKAAEKHLKAMQKSFEQRLAKGIEQASLEAAKALEAQQKTYNAELKKRDLAVAELAANAEVARLARKAGLSDTPEAEAFLLQQLQASKLAVAADEISDRDDVMFGPDGKALLDGKGNELNLGSWIEQQRAEGSWDAYLAAPKGAAPAAPQATAKAPVSTLQAMHAGLQAGRMTNDQLFAAAFGGAK